MKKLYVALFLTFCLACGDSFEETNTLPKANQVILDYPSLATVTITQTTDTTYEYMGSTDVNTVISVLNTTTQTYDTVSFEVFIYKNDTNPVRLNNRALNYYGTFTDPLAPAAAVSDSINSSVNYMLSEELVRLYFYRIGELSHMYSGSYTGTYRKLNEDEPATLGSCAMQIDYEGNMRVLFDASLDSDVLRGFCSEEGEANGPAFTTEVMYDSTSSAFKFPIYRTKNNLTDTIQLNLSRHE